MMDRMRLPGGTAVEARRHHRQTKNNYYSPHNPLLAPATPFSSGTYTLTRRHSGRLDRASNIPPLALRSSGASLFALPVSLRSALFLAATLPLTSVPIVHAQGIGTRHQHTMASESSPDLHAPSQKPMLARHREQDGASGQAQQPRGPYFPLGYKEGFSQWWTSLAPAVTEHKVLSYVPY